MDAQEKATAVLTLHVLKQATPESLSEDEVERRVNALSEQERLGAWDEYKHLVA